MRLQLFTAYSKRPAATVALLSLLALAGCAGGGVSQQAAPAHQNPTLEDAQRQGRGTAVARAPSQLNLGFGDSVQQQQAAQEAADNQPQPETGLRPLSEPKTFLGTVPCLGGHCTAARISLTLAPAGHWRARITPLDGGQAPETQQGCWNVVSQNPPRIILLQGNDVILANLGFINDNVLRVNQIYGSQPTLEYRLTRQAEIDAINELDGQPLPACSPN